jgi:hypothetical protein
MATPETVISTESPRGATVKTTYVERQVKAFAVFDTEVDVLSSLNAQATVFFSVASAALSFAVSIWANAAFYSELTPAGQIASHIVAPALLVVAVLFVGLGVHAWTRRTSTVNAIRQQSTSSTR